MCSSCFYFIRSLWKNCNIVYISLFQQKHEKKVVKVSFLDTQNQTFFSFSTDPDWIFRYKVIISVACHFKTM